MTQPMTDAELELWRNGTYRMTGRESQEIVDRLLARLAADRSSAYEKGWRRGVWQFATWRDGDQFVGSLCRPIAEVFRRGPSDAEKQFDLEGEGIVLRCERDA